MAIRKVVDYKDYPAFKAEDKLVRKAGIKGKGRFLTHVKMGLDCFHTGGSHNVQIVNDLVTTAKEVGYQHGTVAKWIAPMCGHVLEGTVFGKREEGLKYEDLDFAGHLEAYPDWYAFSKSQPKPEYDIVKDRDAMLKTVDNKAKAAKKNGFLAAELELRAIANMLSSLDMTKAAPANAEDVDQVDAVANAA